MGCKAEVRLIASKDGQHLIVQALNELHVHNHELNHEVFRNLPQQRRLGSQDKENVAEMLSVKANTKMIQQRLMSQTGKVVLLKVASYLADFGTRWPHEYEIFNFARFSSRFW